MITVIEYVFRFTDLAKVPMQKIYGSDSVPEKVIKILRITYGILQRSIPSKTKFFGRQKPQFLSVSLVKKKFGEETCKVLKNRRFLEHQKPLVFDCFGTVKFLMFMDGATTRR